MSVSAIADARGSAAESAVLAAAEAAARALVSSARTIGKVNVKELPLPAAL
jgi:hypothetical protein